jgi:hypothetical protein
LQTAFARAACEGPSEGAAQVRQVGFQTIEPLPLLWPTQPGRCVLGQTLEEREMVGPARNLLAAGLQLFAGVLTDCLKHDKA